ncbi:hypothetical protein GCM10008959_34420 [Deinococcus seoulensis]|uniref:DUF2304 domain-containing protein n=1 Tax=Deinococcus seoulensis TaxID=1837379 RepID=A0ABQ2RYL3_9DEIO|nr:hypothetical protein [Deinococcus seoulensis]GGR69628.1 hypothetical protein GCM10008959_34420 [Deinococcus seoulensis]
MNGSLIGLLLLAISLGVASVTCWRHCTTPAGRVLPGLLTLAYYLALWFWPHPALRAAEIGGPPPLLQDQLRLVLLGLALIVTTAKLSWRITQGRERERALERRVRELERGEHAD